MLDVGDPSPSCSKNEDKCLINPNDFKSVTRACWLTSEWGSARKILNLRARRRKGIDGLRAAHVGPNLGSGDDWSEKVTDGD
ncbi:jg9297 [Pararge aegeria aegeria]|uniref:Jg9297 protein n=1 Tax=Pararge aegeria aegeria TaxID=348720 RepID=A0A8S4SKG0_9NEOP|nr:jg9297 [Pararge aegeria aegeria]